jgi:hypothetical protein
MGGGEILTPVFAGITYAIREETPDEAFTLVLSPNLLQDISQHRTNYRSRIRLADGRCYSTTRATSRSSYP